MSDLDQRLNQLTPERRRLLERLAAAKADADTPSPLPDEARIDASRFQFDGDMIQDPDQVQRFYDAVSLQLNAGPFAEHARFLNYGYVPNDNPQRSRVKLPAGQVNRNSIRLVLEVIGDADIGPGHDVLDVGCGRGGTATVLRTHFRPRRVIGIDLATAAVAFCHRTQGDDDTRFVVASAEGLPFPGGSFDFVTNVESSHCYGRIDRFFADVHRVLRPGGCLLYTDLISEQDIASREAFVEDLGFEMEHKRDITSNVLLSCDETAGAHARAFRKENDSALIDSFLGVPTSSLYEAMKDGRQRYLLYRWRKHNRDTKGGPS